MNKLDHFLNKYIRFRPGIIYAYSGIDPDTGKREQWIYVGQTRQPLVKRHNQHMGIEAFPGKKKKRQPWSDLYPSIRVVFQLKCPDIVLDFLEKQTIKWTFPIYNYHHNLKNPRRVELYVAESLRQDRDRLGWIRNL